MIKDTNEDISMNDSDDDSMDIDESIKTITNFETKIDSWTLNADKSKEKVTIELDKDIFKDASTDANKTIKPTEEITNIKELGEITIQEFNNWIRSESSSTSIDLWIKLETLGHDHINKLVEHLKIALEPNKQTKLRANYKSGKRLNIKKIISFIASNYRNDKIWLRRTQPFERDYYITLAIDDSLSMI